jgi:hypothetical protein
MKHKIHKYERSTLGKNEHIIYRCKLPGCGHYILNKELAEGRLSLCWGKDCNNATQISKQMIQKEIKHPMCTKCKELRKARRLELMNIGKE